MGWRIAYLKDMGGAPPLTPHPTYPTHSTSAMRALIAYLVFTTAALGTVGYMAQGLAAGLELQQAERNAAVEALL